MDFNENFNNYIARLQNMKTQLKNLTEESTKMSLVMPFFSMLGYDIFNASEIVPEYTCDVATKKGEKVDYAILKDGDPIMLIEVKRAGLKLQKQQQGQLYRYFSTNRCRIAILTNGIVYQFFSDLNVPNVMDDDPFLSFNLLEDDTALYSSSVRQFSKEKFNIKNVISKAIFQKYSKVVQKTLKEDLLNPSDEMVKYFLSRPEIKTGNRITSQMIEKYREATKKAMQKVFGVTINEFSDDSKENDYNTLEHNTTQLFENNKDNDLSNSDQKNNVEYTPELLQKAIQEFAYNHITACTFKNEETDEIIRIHIYSTNNKVGVVKIQKANMAIQFRRIQNGKPEIFDTNSFDELKQYINSITV